ncbi:hypothetical protein GOV06_05215 [Candidatus Woesearchaeota archaeon]|nr:hypothetical protein [Candidatus Woesearchaeota archaeon]
MGDSQYVETINAMLVEARKGATLYILENEVFLWRLLHDHDSWFKEYVNDKDIHVKVFTWENSHIEELECLGVEVFLLPKYQEQHYAVLSAPRRIWYEEEHKDGEGYAHRCIYTDTPHDEVFQQFLEGFSNLEKKLIPSLTVEY